MPLYTMMQLDAIYDKCLLSYSCLNVTCESAAELAAKITREIGTNINRQAVIRISRYM